MSGILTFNAGEIRKLCEHAASAIEHKPTMWQAIDPAMHKDGVLRDADGNEIQIDSSGWPLPGGWPDSKNIDQTKIPPGLWLVADQGVYLMSNGLPGLIVSQQGDGGPGRERHYVVYARECDPSKMEFDDWYDAKNQIFGGDDGVEYLPLSMFEDIDKLDDKTKIKIHLNKNTFRVEFSMPASASRHKSKG